MDLNRPQALAIGLDEATGIVLDAESQKQGWDLVSVPDLPMAMAHAGMNPVGVVLVQRSEMTSDWRGIVARLASSASKPIVILLSPVADHNLREELVRCGGYEVLRTASDPVRLSQAVRSALLLWRNQSGLREAIR